jgi:Na+-transporting methylmalonyl-CoA/oxaloacetate decarboxylase gamma subunit
MDPNSRPVYTTTEVAPPAPPQPPSTATGRFDSIPVVPPNSPPPPPPPASPGQGGPVSPRGPKFSLPYAKLLIVLGVVCILLFLFALAAYIVGTAKLRSSAIGTPSPSPTPSDTPLPTAEPTPSPEMPTGAAPEATPFATAPADFQTKTITASPTLDGFLTSTGNANNSIDIRAGRNVYAVTRGYVSFDLSSIPKNATIDSVTLRLFQTNTDGSPYTTIGNLKIDHVDYGASLEGEDYALPALGTSVATLTTNGNVEWKEAVVTESLRDDVANHRSTSQYRIRFETEKVGGASGGDYAYFESAENYSGTGNIPQLVVRFK